MNPRWIWMAYRFWIVLLIIGGVLSVSEAMSYGSFSNIFGTSCVFVVFICLPGGVYWAITARNPLRPDRLL